MYILLSEGDIIRKGDEFWREKTGYWMPMSPHTWDFGERVQEGHPPMRRKLSPRANSALAEMGEI